MMGESIFSRTFCRQQNDEKYTNVVFCRYQHPRLALDKTGLHISP